MTGPAETPGYRALAEGAALWIDRERALLRVEGQRAASMLDGLMSADVARLSPGESTLTFVLTSKGRPVAMPTVVRCETFLLLDLSRAGLPGLLAHFETYLPPRFATVVPLEDACRVSLIGPRAVDVAARIEARGSLARAERTSFDGLGFDYYFADAGAGASALESAALSAGAERVAAADYEAWRIEMGTPRFGQDVTPDNLPQETGLDSRAVSFEKGCYTGQEVVARIHYRGHVNRHLRGLRSLRASEDGSPSPGAPIVSDGREIGQVTSWCVSPRFGPIGLGYVRREFAVGDEVEVRAPQSLSCQLTQLPFTQQ